MNFVPWMILLAHVALYLSSLAFSIIVWWIVLELRSGYGDHAWMMVEWIDVCVERSIAAV